MITSTNSPMSLNRLLLRRVFAFSLLFGVSSVIPVQAESPLIFTLHPNETANTYFEVNLTGTVYLKIAAPPGQEPCADFWWIKWPLGNVEQLGRLCDTAQLEVPGLSRFAFAARLRAGGAKSVVKVGIAAQEAVAHSLKFEF